MITNDSFKKISLKEFAEHICKIPDILTYFTKKQDENHLEHSCRYGIATINFISSRCVIINTDSIVGGTLFMFDLPLYNNEIDFSEEQNDECVNDMVNGLKDFCQKYDLPIDDWYIDMSEYEIM